MRLISDIPLKKRYEMKKYRVLRDCYFGLAGELFINSVHPEEFMKSLVKEGWLSEVEEEKELCEKLYDYYYSTPENNPRGDCIGYAKIARQHFAEVARKAQIEADYKLSHGWVSSQDAISIIISAIEKDGEN